MWFWSRQLDESIVQNGEMDGLLLHLQNEQKEAVVKEEPNLHLYSSKDVDMWAVYSVTWCGAIYLICLVILFVWVHVNNSSLLKLEGIIQSLDARKIMLKFLFLLNLKCLIIWVFVWILAFYLFSFYSLD